MEGESEQHFTSKYMIEVEKSNTNNKVRLRPSFSVDYPVRKQSILLPRFWILKRINNCDTFIRIDATTPEVPLEICLVILVETSAHVLSIDPTRAATTQVHRNRFRQALKLDHLVPDAQLVPPADVVFKLVLSDVAVVDDDHVGVVPDGFFKSIPARAMGKWQIGGVEAISKAAAKLVIGRADDTSQTINRRVVLDFSSKIGLARPWKPAHKQKDLTLPTQGKISTVAVANAVDDGTGLLFKVQGT